MHMGYTVCVCVCVCVCVTFSRKRFFQQICIYVATENFRFAFKIKLNILFIRLYSVLPIRYDDNVWEYGLHYDLSFASVLICAVGLLAEREILL